MSFFKVNVASKMNEKTLPESVGLQYGESKTDVVLNPLFHRLQMVQSNLVFQPEMKQVDVSLFLGSEDVLLLVELLEDFVPSTFFPAYGIRSAALFLAHENILRFAIYYSDDFLITRLAEKFFGFIYDETRHDFLRFVYNCKENGEESAYVMGVFFRKQAEMASKLDPSAQGLLLSAFSEIVPADISIFRHFFMQGIECTRLEQYKSHWVLDDRICFTLGNVFSEDEWKLEIRNGNPHLEIALHLIQPSFSRGVSSATSFLHLLLSLRRGFEEETVMRHISGAIQCAVDLNFFDLVFEWFHLIETHGVSLYSIAVVLLEKGIENSNLRITRFASEKLRNIPVLESVDGDYCRLISRAIVWNTSIEVFEALFPLPQEIMIPSFGRHLGSAIAEGRKDIALSLFKKHADRNQKYMFQEVDSVYEVQPYVLTLAIKKGWVEFVRALLKDGAVVNLIHFEESFKNIEILEILYESQVNPIQQFGSTLLASAAMSGHLDAVLFLESKGMKYSLTDFVHFQPSCSSYVEEQPASQMDLPLILHVENFPRDTTFLGELALRGHADVLIHFLEQEEYLSDRLLEEVWSHAFFRSRYMQSDKVIEIMQHLHSKNSAYFPLKPIKDFVANLSLDILEMLLNTFGDLFIAVAPSDSITSLRRSLLVKRLLSMPPDLIPSCDSLQKPRNSINTQADLLDGLDVSLLPNDALFTALKDKRYHDCDRLFKETAQITFVDKGGQNLLHIAASVREIERISFILDNFEQFEALVNQPDNYGNTCLHYAVQHQVTDFIQFLIMNNADIHQKNIRGKSPLQLAISKPEIYKLLVSSDSFKLTRRRENDEMSEYPSSRKRLKK